jgi:glycosyltransferase involved in cell wall biosynthesis
MSDAGDNPLVSVIIPAYNQGPMLVRAIESALSQTYPNVEIIVVNDGSPDPITTQTASQFEGRIRYIERENGGVAAARNTGIEAARGELIALLDQDDVWLPHKLDAQVRALRAHAHAALVHSSYYLIDEAGHRTGAARLPEREWYALPDLLLDIPIASCTCLIPRWALDETGLFDPALAGSDDWDLWLRMAALGYRFYCVSEPLAEYRLHAANTSRNIGLMVRAGLGVLDKFYSLPNLPPVAFRYRGQAYFKRHVWAVALYYGAGRLNEARGHLRQAAQFYPEGIATGRFLQSLVYAGAEQPSKVNVQEALRFVQYALNGKPLPRGIRRKLRAYSRLVLALHTGAGRQMQVAEVAQALLAHPHLLANRDLWAAGMRMVLHTGRRIKNKHRSQDVYIVE